MTESLEVHIALCITKRDIALQHIACTLDVLVQLQCTINPLIFYSHARLYDERDPISN